MPPTSTRGWSLPSGRGRSLLWCRGRATTAAGVFTGSPIDLSMLDGMYKEYPEGKAPEPRMASWQAPRRRPELFQQHEQDIEIEIHLNEMGSILFNKQRMHTWCYAGYPAIQVAN